MRDVVVIADRERCNVKSLILGRGVIEESHGLLLFTLVSGQQMPSHKGDLTPCFSLTVIPYSNINALNSCQRSNSAANLQGTFKTGALCGCG